MAAVVFVEIACYLFYPIWDRESVTPLIGFIAALAHLSGLVIILAWWLPKLVSESAVPKTWQWQALAGADGIAIMFVLVVAFALQWHFLNLPLISGPDEPVQVRDHFLQWRLLAATTPRAATTALLLMVSAAMFVLITVLLRFLGAVDTGPPRTRSPARIVVLLTAAFVAYAGIDYFLLPTPWGLSSRWPPLGTVASVAAHTIFGSNEFASRFPALVFYLLTGLFLYRLVLAEYDRSTALAAAVLCLSAPVFFQHGHLAFRETGGAFFTTAGAFYLVRYLRFDRNEDFAWVAAASIAGYLERQPAVILVIVAAGSLAFWRAFSAKSGSRVGTVSWAAYFLVLTLVIWMLLPWVVISRNERPYGFAFANWLHWDLISAYAAALPEAVGWPLTVLATIGLALAAQRRHAIDVVSVVWLALVYILFTTDKPQHIPEPRFVAAFCPPLAILAAGVLNSVWRSDTRAAIAIRLSAILFGLLALTSWYLSAPVAYTRPAKAFSFSSEPYFPFDQLAAFVTAVNKGSVIIGLPAPWQAALPAYASLNRLAIRTVMPGWNTPPTSTLRDFIEYCRHQHCDYGVIPMRRRQGQWRSPLLRDVDTDRLVMGDETPLPVVKVFTLNDHALALVEFP